MYTWDHLQFDSDVLPVIIVVTFKPPVNDKVSIVSNDRSLE